MKRRDFLRLAALAPATGLASSGRAAWAAGNGRSAVKSRKRLVVVFLRGAVDGLNVVVPHNETRYYDARPTIAIPPPGGENGAINLDGYFGLHPALAALAPLWNQGSLAFIHACGSPDPTRSHFDAQDYMESGTPGVKSTPDGWMNRLLAVLPGPHVPTEAVSLGPTMPRILSGNMSVANLPLGRNAANPMPLDRPMIADAYDRLYSGNDSLSRTFREGQMGRKRLMAELKLDMTEADNGAPSPRGFPADAGRLARLIAQDSTIELSFLALGGWDTHVNQGASQGQLASHLRPLAEGLAALAKGLGPAYRDTVVLVISEFGRTMHENGNRGTDHGHGNVMWVMGGNIRGGKVYGDWPGLSSKDLYQNRDLAVTTDFRAAIATVLERHLHLSDRQLAAVFPGMPKSGASLSAMIRT